MCYGIDMSICVAFTINKPSSLGAFPVPPLHRVKHVSVKRVRYPVPDPQMHIQKPVRQMPSLQTPRPIHIQPS
jgi:hypothetical protein